MAKKTKKLEPELEPPTGPRPRLAKLAVRNFRCIGPSPVVIDLDDIVVLVGPNNAGKSSLLQAYELIMSPAKAGQLTLDDFPNGRVDNDALPEIELHTICFEGNKPGPEWLKTVADGEYLVREKWTWSCPGTPKRLGFNVELDRWAEDNDREQVPWGAAGVAKARRPQAHRVDAFASPEKQADQIVSVLMAAINSRVTQRKADAKLDPESDYGMLLRNVATLQSKIVEESTSQIRIIEQQLSAHISRVFPDHCVVFDAKAEDDPEKAVNLFKASGQLLMGRRDGHMSTVSHQGSGARRTLLWTAIRLLAESGARAGAAESPHVLLLDEPEICLHPSAIRDACAVLYSLPQVTRNWQVMLTTHSPCFVDFSRDHTSIVRVERESDGRVVGTTIFRPEKAGFDGSDKECLKLLTLCDPHVAEFFFGGRTIVVEGDTEYVAFKHVVAQSGCKFDGVHIVRARGKATIVSLCKILNQFGAPYAVLHDSDHPKCEREGKLVANPAWTLNDAIREVMEGAPGQTRRVASVPNFEAAYLGIEGRRDKPYQALASMKADPAQFSRVEELLCGLVDVNAALPTGAREWKNLAELEAAVSPGEVTV